MLFLPEVELDYSDPEWTDAMPFGWGLLKDGDLYENYRRLLGLAVQKLGLKGKRIGVEQSFEVVAPTYRSAEPVVPAKPWADLLKYRICGFDAGGYHRFPPGRPGSQERL